MTGATTDADGQSRLRTGVDVQSIEAFRELEPAVFEGIKTRSFTEAERRYCDGTAHPHQHYAGRWAAKEAFRKVVGQSVPLQSVAVERTDGPPALSLGPRAESALSAQFGTDRWHLDVSLSHDRRADAAVAHLVGTGGSHG